MPLSAKGRRSLSRKMKEVWRQRRAAKANGTTHAASSAAVHKPRTKRVPAGPPLHFTAAEPTRKVPEQLRRVTSLYQEVQQLDRTSREFLRELLAS